MYTMHSELEMLLVGKVIGKVIGKVVFSWFPAKFK
jgi:hypothetical protein